MLEHILLILKVRLLAIWRRPSMLILLLIIPILTMVLLIQTKSYAEYIVPIHSNINGNLSLIFLIVFK